MGLIILKQKPFVLTLITPQTRLKIFTLPVVHKLSSILSDTQALLPQA